jgi:putative aminopeptidase FrvX
VIEITRKLVQVYGPSGREEGIRAVIREEVADLADEVRVDTLGSLIATMNGDGSGRQVMLAAHMDEIGVIVTHIDEKGFLRFGTIGGVRPDLCVGNRVKFADGTIGTIWAEKRENLKTSPDFDQLYIDVGASGRESCPVKVGDMAGFDRAFVAQGDRWTSKAMDDRIGCAILIGAMRAIREQKLKLSHTVHFVFSVQEEVGTRGATTAAYGLEPEIGIAVDVTGAGDTPKPQFPMAVSLGDGPAIKVKDLGMIAHAGLVQLMVQRAEENGIPYQMEVLTRGSTDARAMQLVHAGVIAGTVSVPCRYVHSVSEMVDAKDVDNAVKLLLACLKGPLNL